MIILMNLFQNYHKPNFFKILTIKKIFLILTIAKILLLIMRINIINKFLLTQV